MGRRGDTGHDQCGTLRRRHAGDGFLAVWLGARRGHHDHESRDAHLGGRNRAKHAQAGPEAPPLTSFQTWATSLSDTEWQVHMRVQTGNKRLDGADDQGWVYPADDYGRIMVFTTCAKD